MNLYSPLGSRDMETTDKPMFMSMQQEVLADYKWLYEHQQLLLQSTIQAPTVLKY